MKAKVVLDEVPLANCSLAESDPETRAFRAISTLIICLGFASLVSNSFLAIALLQCSTLSRSIKILLANKILAALIATVHLIVRASLQIHRLDQAVNVCEFVESEVSSTSCLLEEVPFCASFLFLTLSAPFLVLDRILLSSGSRIMAPTKTVGKLTTILGWLLASFVSVGMVFSSRQLPPVAFCSPLTVRMRQFLISSAAFVFLLETSAFLGYVSLYDYSRGRLLRVAVNQATSRLLVRFRILNIVKITRIFLPIVFLHFGAFATISICILYVQSLPNLRNFFSFITISGIYCILLLYLLLYPVCCFCASKEIRDGFKLQVYACVKQSREMHWSGQQTPEFVQTHHRTPAEYEQILLQFWAASQPERWMGLNAYSSGRDDSLTAQSFQDECL